MLNLKSEASIQFYATDNYLSKHLKYKPQQLYNFQGIGNKKNKSSFLIKAPLKNGL